MVDRLRWRQSPVGRQRAPKALRWKPRRFGGYLAGGNGRAKIIAHDGLAFCSFPFRHMRSRVRGATASVAEFDDAQSAVPSPQGRFARPTSARSSPTLAVAPERIGETETLPPSRGRGCSNPMIFAPPASPSRFSLHGRTRIVAVYTRKPPGARTFACARSFRCTTHHSPLTSSLLTRSLPHSTFAPGLGSMPAFRSRLETVRLG